MRLRGKRLAICGLAVFAMVMAGSSMASATEYPLTGLPEIGRCVSKPGEGGFKGLKAVCIVHSLTHKGNFEWLPGPGDKGTFKDRLSNPTLETVGGGRIVCSFIFMNGEITSGKNLKISNLTMQGCLLVGPNLPCFSNPTEQGTIESTTPLVGELGFIPGSPNPANPWVGWDLKAESELSGTMVEFGCGEGKLGIPTYKVSLEGSVIARVKKTNKMISVFEITYKQSAGKQIPSAFTGGPEDVLTQITTLTTNPLEPKEEQAGLQTGGEMEMGEAMEVKAREKFPLK